MRIAFLACVSVLLGCAPTQKKVATASDEGGTWSDPAKDWPRHNAPSPQPLSAATENPSAKSIALVGGTVLTATGKRYKNGSVFLRGGKISYVGPKKTTPPGSTVIDATGKFVTPGLIDTHSHIGVFAVPRALAHRDGNEATAPTTAHAQARYGYWPQDPSIPRALAGGVTTALILPGSANLIGGRGFTVTMQPGRTAEEVEFPGAPLTVKMACGENPKRVYGDKGGPQTRMAEYALFRSHFHKAAEYLAKKKAYVRKKNEWLKKKENKKAGSKPSAAPDPIPVDLGLETISKVLSGDVLVQVHCYRAGEMREMAAIADEFGFSIRSFHHALEAYKIRDILSEKKIAISTWADWWGFKLEAFDGIPENAAMFSNAGGTTVIHSDSAIGIQRLNQEAAKAMYSGRAAGISITEDEALRWITANPAWVLGIDSVTGTLEAGKRADVVIWDGSPFSVYALPDTVIQEGQVAYRRTSPPLRTDFELKNAAAVDQRKPGKEVTQ